nr:peptidyl-tRNA hydrolase Pth2 [Candidatus Sigynarchaeum springense]MDO8116199.1 peptidyl-tRNA hydrolase Pth2 [Candidatus Sigynarchaeota archaeon]
MHIAFVYKQFIVIRADLKMSAGKALVQGAHASILAAEKVRRVSPDTWKAWFNEGQRKIACKVQSLDDLLQLKGQVERLNVPCEIVADAGLTQLEPGTITALGIGPVLETTIDPVTRNLKLL